MAADAVKRLVAPGRRLVSSLVQWLAVPVRRAERRPVGAIVLLGVLCALLTVPLRAQSAAELVAAADREIIARHPTQAIPLLERAIESEPRNVAALCKLTSALVDLTEFETDVKTRTALSTRAVAYARRAIAVNPKDAEGHFQLGRALGRIALSLGPKDKVNYAVEVRAEALTALSLAPQSPGPMHILGVWNAEIMRLSSLIRFLAKKAFGAKDFDAASWADAVRYMEQAVALDPLRGVHRLDLARIYRDLGRLREARAAYQAVLSASLIDYNDEQYKRQAQQELAALPR